MSSLYDNSVFFQNYLDLRNDAENYNDLFEQPEMMEMLPNIKGKSILELGCGYGATSVKFVENGAAFVYAFDISEKMIQKAVSENQRENISYHCMDMSQLDNLDESWDIAFSSLAFHYIEDLNKVFRDVYHHLVPDGVFLFSMEHPITTAAMKECLCEFDEEGKPVYFKLDHYAETGKREVVWLDTNIVKYHRTVSDVLNGLIDAGFTIKKVKEPIPSEKMRDCIPRMLQEVHRPSYLMCCCQKKE